MPVNPPVGCLYLAVGWGVGVVGGWEIVAVCGEAVELEGIAVAIVGVGDHVLGSVHFVGLEEYSAAIAVWVFAHVGVVGFDATAVGLLVPVEFAGCAPESGVVLLVSSSLQATIVGAHFGKAVDLPVLVVVAYVGLVVLSLVVSVVLGTFEVGKVVVEGNSSMVLPCPGYSFVEKNLVASYTRMVLGMGWAFVKGAPKGVVRATVALLRLLA